MKKIKCIAIYYEPLALLVISQFCERKGNIELTTYCEPKIGLEEIIRKKPDLVFLDIEMNSISGLDIAHILPHDTCFIFTTAHAQYALDGFDLNATDFLHKPFSYERFEKAIEKAFRYIENIPNRVTETIIVKQEYNNISIAISDILYIEAMENYIKIFRVNDNYILTHTNLKNIQKMLPENKFIRIHRSYIIPIEKVEIFSKKEIKLSGKETPLPIGRQFSNNVYNILTGKNVEYH